MMHAEKQEGVVDKTEKETILATLIEVRGREHGKKWR
jgi:hypothetical protein